MLRFREKAICYENLKRVPTFIWMSICSDLMEHMQWPNYKTLGKESKDISFE